MRDKCVWEQEDDDMSSHYESGCGMSFVFDERGPIENDFNYCPKCGSRVCAVNFDEDI